MWNWLKSDDEPPDAWTRDRRQKVVLIDHFNGDVDKAVTAWRQHTGEEYGRYLFRTGRIGQGDDARGR